MRSLAIPFFELVRRARSLFAFLKIPLAVVLLFAILAAVTYNVDSALSKDAVKDSWVLEFLDELFGDRGSTRAVLSTLASALITVTSITFSLLLVAVQQGASSLSSQILDQFLKRRSNQFYFGFFVGLSLFTLITLATTHGVHYPLFGALFAIIGTIAALCIILVLLYTTVQQMRSADVISAIADLTRSAGDKHLQVLERTRDEPRKGLQSRLHWHCETAGVLTNVNVKKLDAAAADCAAGDIEVVLKVAAGSYVAKGEELAEVRARTPLDTNACDKLRQALRSCLSFGQRSDLRDDPRVGIHQLSTIGWNSASSARSNPRPPVLVCRTIADLLWEWTEKPIQRDASSRVVYPDLLVDDCIEAIDSIVVASAEAKQHVVLAEAYETYARLLPRLQPVYRERMEEAVRLSLSALSHHVPTIRLNRALDRLADALSESGSALGDKIRAVRRRETSSGEFSQTAVPASS